MMPLARRIVEGEGAFYGLLLTVLTQVAVIGINVITGVITARLLGPDGRGEFAAITLWPQVLSGLASMGLPIAATYNICNHGEARSAIFTVTVLLTLATSGI